METEVISVINSIEIQNNQETTSSFTQDNISNDLKVEEIRKRLVSDINSSVIWSEFIFTKSDEQDNPWELQDIFNFPHEGSIRLSHSKKYDDMLKDENTYILKCKHCNFQSNFYKTSESSPKALEHIEKVHPELLKIKTPNSKKPRGTVITDDDFINKSNMLMAATIITSKLSYSTVENKSLNDLVSHLQGQDPKYIPPGREPFSNKIIPIMHEKIKELIKQEIKEAEGCCAKLDGWSKKLIQIPF